MTGLRVYTVAGPQAHTPLVYIFNIRPSPSDGGLAQHRGVGEDQAEGDIYMWTKRTCAVYFQPSRG